MFHQLNQKIVFLVLMLICDYFEWLLVNYYFYIKKDYNISGYEKLYFDLEETDYHEKIPILKEIIFKIVILGITAAIILMQ